MFFYGFHIFDVAKFFKENAKEGDMVITMGAGDVYKIGELIIDK